MRDPSYKIITPEKEIEFSAKNKGQSNDFYDITSYLDTNEKFQTEKINLKIKTQTPVIIAHVFQIPKTAQKPWFMIPGFLYGSNNLKGSNGKQPKFDYGKPANWPNSGVFWTRADRSTHNCLLVILKNEIICLGIDEMMQGAVPDRKDQWEPAFFYNGLFIDTRHPEYDEFGVTMGYRHFPKRYSFEWDDPQTPSIGEYKAGWLHGLKDQTLTCSVFFCQDKVDSLANYGTVLRKRYYSLHQPPGIRAKRYESIEILAENLLNKGWNKEHKFFYLADNEDGRMIGDLAWTGGLQVAYPLMLAGHKTGKSNYINISRQFIENVVKNAINSDANLLKEEWREGKWQITGWWGIRENCMNMGDNPKHTAYLNGQAAYYLLKAYVLDDRKNKSWLNTAEMVLQTALKSQNKKGAYAWLFDPVTGKGVDYDGFQSCWFVPAMTLLAAETNNETYKNSAIKALDHYYTWHEKGELYNTPMDTHNAVDEEGNLAFVIACVELHKYLGDKKFIAYGKIGLDYEFTWKFPYNTKFSNEPLKSMNWSTCGGSITSTHNPHIHPMGNLIAGEIYYLYQQTGDKYLADRLRDTCIWGNGVFNRFDNDFGFGEKGAITEQFFYSDALLLPWWKKWDGGIWEANLPWGAGCTLLTCAEDIPDEFFE